MAAAMDNLMDFTPPSGPSTVRSQSGNSDRRSRGRPAGLQINTGPPAGEQKMVAESPASQQRPMTHLQLRRLLQDLSKGADQRSVKQLTLQVFPKMAVLQSADPSLAPPLLKLLNDSEDKLVIRYVFYFLSRILGESDTSVGGAAGRNWDAVSKLDGQGAITPKEAMSAVLNSLLIEASSNDPSGQGRRAAALKAFICMPHSNVDAYTKLYTIVESIFDKTTEGTKLKRKKGIFARQSADKEALMRSNLQYLALSTVLRMPNQSMDEEMLRKVVQGIACHDPVGARHALAKLAALANKNPLLIANALSKLAFISAGATGSMSESPGVLMEAMHIPDTFAKVYLARLLSTMIYSQEVKKRRGLWEQFASLLYQLISDEHEKIALEAILGIIGSAGGEGSMELRSAGWDLLCAAEVVVPEIAAPKEGPSKGKVPTGRIVKRNIFKVACNRLDFALCSSSRPSLHAAARVVGEIGKARAAAALISETTKAQNKYEEEAKDAQNMADGPSSVLDGPTLSSPLIGGGLEALSPSLAPLADMEQSADKEMPPEESTFPEEEPLKPALSLQEITAALSKLMEAVRTVVACECPYVRASALKAMIWMQSADESADELKETIAGELTDPSWPASLLNDLLLTLHLRFKATPSMAAMLLDVAGLWVTLVPAKVDTDVLQNLWKTCLMGCGPEGKQAALEAVGNIVDLRNTSGPYHSGPTEANEAADAKSAVALQRLIQAAVWFLGENANFAAGEYAWEPPDSAALGLLRMMEGSAMLSAAAGRNATLALSIARLQRTVFCGSWEVRIVAAQALMTVALRSGEPYRFQIYEFFHTLYFGSKKDKLSAADVSNGEDQGASGTGLTTVLLPMMRLLDEMYQAQDQLLKDLRQHENAGQPWSDDELALLYQTHERLLELVSIFCFIPRNSYLPLGPWSLPLVNLYRSTHAISAEATQDPAVLAGISDLLLIGGGSEFVPAGPAQARSTGASGLEDLLWGGTPPGMDLVNDFLGGQPRAGSGSTAEGGATQTGETGTVATNIESMWEASLLDGFDDDRKDNDGRSSGSSTPESTRSGGSDRRSNLSGFPSRLALMSPPREEMGEEDEDDIFETKVPKSPRLREQRFHEASVSSPGTPGSPAEPPSSEILTGATAVPPQELSGPHEGIPTPGDSTYAARHLPANTGSMEASGLPGDSAAASAEETSTSGGRHQAVGSFISMLFPGRSSSSISMDSAVVDENENADEAARAADTPSIDATSDRAATSTANIPSTVPGAPSASGADVPSPAGDEVPSAAAAAADAVHSDSRSDYAGEQGNTAATDGDTVPAASADAVKASEGMNQPMVDLLSFFDDSTSGQTLQTSSTPSVETKTQDLLGDGFGDFPSTSSNEASTSGKDSGKNEIGQDQSTSKDDHAQFDFLGLSSDLLPGPSTSAAKPATSMQTDFLSDLLAQGLGSTDVRDSHPDRKSDDGTKLQQPQGVSSAGEPAEPAQVASGSSPVPLRSPSPESTSVDKEGGKRKKSKGKGFLGLFETGGGGKSTTQSKHAAASSSSADSESSGGSRKRGEGSYQFTPGSDLENEGALSRNTPSRVPLPPLGAEGGSEGMGLGRGGDSPYLPGDVAADIAAGPPLSSRKPPLPGPLRSDSGPGSVESAGPAAQSTDGEQSEEGVEVAERGKEPKKSKGGKSRNKEKKKSKTDKQNDENCVVS